MAKASYSVDNISGPSHPALNRPHIVLYRTQSFQAYAPTGNRGRFEPLLVKSTAASSASGRVASHLNSHTDNHCLHRKFLAKLKRSDEKGSKSSQKDGWLSLELFEAITKQTRHNTTSQAHFPDNILQWRTSEIISSGQGDSN
ncbi:hypothetical protein RRG08_010758 [Elysia crispata]|uniref:Uncharacterized protein n=1 Tax=Elysia crispata TaxID=231223 RepID=A0AAE1DRQ3_9GAST|nr:hypothetical protein RRG08_010758 [Elysia crispata]